ncbi:MAG TPA: hypothetical protein VJM53_05995 [Burkholderiales bacterium]|nr:hypothetical protein [Burkholderiales bacterium]
MKKIGALLFTLVLLYGLASLFHFSHNAIYLERYPNMPAWISRSGVMGAWLSIAAIGVVGCAALLGDYRKIGLAILGLYAAMGFDGLAHYCLAPISAHSLPMNFSIWLEVLAAALLLTAVCAQALGVLRASRIPRQA